MFGEYNGFVSKARVSACMYFLVIYLYQPPLASIYQSSMARTTGGWGVTPQRKVKKAGAQLAQREPRNAGIAERVKY